MVGAKLVLLVLLLLVLQHHHHHHLLLLVVLALLLHFADRINKCVLVMINVVQRPAGPMEDVGQPLLLLLERLQVLRRLLQPPQLQSQHVTLRLIQLLLNQRPSLFPSLHLSQFFLLLQSDQPNPIRIVRRLIMYVGIMTNVVRNSVIY